MMDPKSKKQINDEIDKIGRAAVLINAIHAVVEAMSNVVTAATEVIDEATNSTTVSYSRLRDELETLTIYQECFRELFPDRTCYDAFLESQDADGLLHALRTPLIDKGRVN